MLCGQGVAPAGATIDHYRMLGLDLVPGSGLLAATVPGSWDTWLTMLRDHGTKSLREVLGYAIGYASDGYPTVDRIAADRRDGRPTCSPTTGRPRPRCGCPAAGRRRAGTPNPVLADTWERLLTEAESAGADREAQIEAARRAWSQGFVAEAVDAFSRNAFPGRLRP